MALMFTGMFTPWEVAFLDSKCFESGLFYLNRAVDVIFVRSAAWNLKRGFRMEKRRFVLENQERRDVVAATLIRIVARSLDGLNAGSGVANRQGYLCYTFTFGA